MASMKELFPLHNYHKKTRRNFVKENIRNAKGCAQCIAERKNSENPSEKCETKKSSTSSKCYKSERESKTTLRYNVKLTERDESCHGESKNTPLRSMNEIVYSRGCQTDSNQNEEFEKPPNCQNCGHAISRHRGAALQTTKDENHIASKLKTSSNNRELMNNQKEKDSHQISHENENTKKDPPSKKQLNPETYKMGEVPKYLQERNAKLMKEQQEKRRREQLEELMGLRDPKCPPGHMLMPLDELHNKLTNMETTFNYLIQELNKMPVSNDSLRIRQRRIQIEKQLNDLDEQIQLYRTKKVFIKIPN